MTPNDISKMSGVSTFETEANISFNDKACTTLPKPKKKSDMKSRYPLDINKIFIVVINFGMTF